MYDIDLEGNVLNSFIYGFNRYFVIPAFITNPICWVILTWPWPLFDLDRQGQICQFCLFNYFHYLWIQLLLRLNNICDLTDILDDFMFPFIKKQNGRAMFRYSMPLLMIYICQSNTNHIVKSVHIYFVYEYLDGHNIFCAEDNSYVHKHINIPRSHDVHDVIQTLLIIQSGKLLFFRTCTPRNITWVRRCKIYNTLTWIWRKRIKETFTKQY